MHNAYYVISSKEKGGFKIDLSDIKTKVYSQNVLLNDCKEDNRCSCNSNYYQCCTNCPVGETGPAGPQGIPGGVLNFADFNALMPPDNTATVAPGTDVSFPQNGPISSTDLTRLDDSSFNLGNIGTYQIFFNVPVDEAGQLILTLNGEDLDYTVAGRATGASQIIGMAIVETTAVDSVLTVRNPAGNAAALTITPLADGTRPVSAHLVIIQIQ